MGFRSDDSPAAIGTHKGDLAQDRTENGTPETGNHDHIPAWKGRLRNRSGQAPDVARSAQSGVQTHMGEGVGDHARRSQATEWANSVHAQAEPAAQVLRGNIGTRGDPRKDQCPYPGEGGNSQDHAVIDAAEAGKTRPRILPGKSTASSNRETTSQKEKAHQNGDHICTTSKQLHGSTGNSGNLMDKSKWSSSL